jgi:thymidylate synthase
MAIDEGLEKLSEKNPEISQKFDEEFDLQKYDAEKDAEFVEIYTKLQAGNKVGIIHRGGCGNIPVIYANGNSLAEAWENSLICLWMNSCFVRTEYDKKADGTGYFPPSKDCTMVMVVDEPLSEPFVHRSFPGGLEDLEEYRQEVLDGIKNHWIRDPNDPTDKRWEYTYNERYRAYRVPGLAERIDQFEKMAERLAKSPISRRAQMVTWQPWLDMEPEVEDPPCWQSYWARMPRHKEGNLPFLCTDKEGQLYLNINMRFRSRDAYKAAFMNDFAFILLAKKLAGRISELRGEEVKLGRFIDQSDSYHIYGSDFEDFKNKFIKLLKERSFEDRTWTMEFAQPFFDEAKPVIEQKIREKDEQDEIEGEMKKGMKKRDEEKG